MYKIKYFILYILLAAKLIEISVSKRFLVAI